MDKAAADFEGGTREAILESRRALQFYNITKVPQSWPPWSRNVGSMCACPAGKAGRRARIQCQQQRLRLKNRNERNGPL